MQFDATQFKDLFANWPSGVAVITCTGTDGRPQGFTASSVVSVSLEPPLVLFALKRTSGSYAHFSKANTFAVNMLSQEQQGVSTVFATPGAERFQHVAYAPGPKTGAPLLDRAWGHLECKLYARYDGGDHDLFVGEIVGLKYEEAEPLVYHRRGYRAIASPAATSTQRAK